MEGEGYLRKFKDIAFELLAIVNDMENEKEEENKQFDNLRSDGKIIYFPTYFTQTEKQEETNNENEIIPDFLEFTEKELQKMPKEFNNLFKRGKTKAHVRKRNDVYEIRCQVNNVKISASSKNLETAKLKFIEKIRKPQQYVQKKTKKSLLFGTYILKWLETVKKPYVKENTYKSYLQTVNFDILPVFGKKELKKITSFDIQEHINNYNGQGKNRTAQKTYQLMNALFNYAVADGIIDRSPTAKVIIGTYEQEHGSALTRTEEKKFIESFLQEPTLNKQAYAFILYTGLRRAELVSATIDDKWITVINAKQKKGKKEKTRRIPISPMLNKVLKIINLEQIKQIASNTLTCKFGKCIPNHHLHDLRHTFITRCQECGIPREIVSLWAGHAADSSITSIVYTHLESNEEHQLSEIVKFDYDL